METKTDLNKETISTIQDLVQVSIDSRDCILEAIENIEDMTVAAMLRELAAERNDQVSELRTLVVANYQEPESKGTFTGTTHRAWMDLRSALGGGIAAMLREAERGEDRIKEKYEKALKELAGSAVTDVLNRQYASVKRSHDRVRDLRDAYNEA